METKEFILKLLELVINPWVVFGVFVVVFFRRELRGKIKTANWILKFKEFSISAQQVQEAKDAAIASTQDADAKKEIEKLDRMGIVLAKEVFTDSERVVISLNSSKVPSLLQLVKMGLVEKVGDHRIGFPPSSALEFKITPSGLATISSLQNEHETQQDGAGQRR